MALAADTITKRSPTISTSYDNNQHQPVHKSLFNEDIFSQLLGGPLLFVHFAFYAAVPIYYLAHYSPFSHLDALVIHPAVKWALLFITEYVTAIFIVSWSGSYKVRKEVAAFLYMGTAMVLMAGVKNWVEERVGAAKT